MSQDQQVILKLVTDDCYLLVHEVLARAEKLSRALMHPSITTEDVNTVLVELGIDPVMGCDSLDADTTSTLYPFTDAKAPFAVHASNIVIPAYSDPVFDAYWLAVDGKWPQTPQNVRRSLLNDFMSMQSFQTRDVISADQAAQDQLPPDITACLGGIVDTLQTANQPQRVAVLKKLSQSAGIQPLLPAIEEWVTAIDPRPSAQEASSQTPTMVATALCLLYSVARNQTTSIEPYFGPLLGASITFAIHADLSSRGTDTFSLTETPEFLTEGISSSPSHFTLRDAAALVASLFVQRSELLHDGLRSRVLQLALAGLYTEPVSHGTEFGCLCLISRLGVEAVLSALQQDGFIAKIPGLQEESKIVVRGMLSALDELELESPSVCALIDRLRGALS